MFKRTAAKVLAFTLLLSICVSQSACGFAKRMRQPVEDFRAATNLVTASTEAGYLIVNRRVIDRFLKKKQCADIDAADDCKTKSSDPDARLMVPSDVRKARIFSDEAIRARLEAFQTLNKYVTLLAAIANTDKAEKVGRSANELKSSIDALADRIADMAKPSGGNSGEGASGITNNSANFVNAVQLFSTAIGMVLTAIAEHKQDKALQEAIKNGTGPTQALMTAIESDLDTFWSSTVRELNKEREVVFEAFNDELTEAASNGKRADTAKLAALRKAVMDVLEKQSTLEASNPKNAIQQMGRAHQALVDAANEPVEKNFVAALGTVEAYVRAATRLGAAIVKLAEEDQEENE